MQHTHTPDEDNVLTVKGLKCKSMINACCQSHFPPGGNLYEKQAFPLLSKTHGDSHTHLVSSVLSECNKVMEGQAL